MDKQRKISESGTWTCNLRIDVPGLYQLSYLALHWRSPYFVNIFVRGGGAPVRSHETTYCPFSQGSRPSYDTTWEEYQVTKLRYNLGRGSKGMHHKGIRLFFYKHHVINQKGNWLGTFIYFYCCYNLGLWAMSSESLFRASLHTEWVRKQSMWTPLLGVFFSFSIFVCLLPIQLQKLKLHNPGNKWSWPYLGKASHHKERKDTWQRALLG